MNSSSCSASDSENINNQRIDETALEDELDVQANSDEKPAKTSSFFEIKNTPSRTLITASQVKTSSVDSPFQLQPGRVVEPDTNIVKRAYKYDTSLVDGMNFKDDFSHNWGVITQDFVIGNSNHRIKEFLSIVHAAKIETERKMRFQLDLKILNSRNSRLTQVLGKEFIQRIRYYIKRLYLEMQM